MMLFWQFTYALLVVGVPVGELVIFMAMPLRLVINTAVLLPTGSLVSGT